MQQLARQRSRKQHCLLYRVTSLPPRALEQQWSGLKHSLRAEAMHLSSLSSGLERQALQPLQVYLLTDLEKRFRQVSPAH